MNLPASMFTPPNAAAFGVVTAAGAAPLLRAYEARAKRRTPAAHRLLPLPMRPAFGGARQGFLRETGNKAEKPGGCEAGHRCWKPSFRAGNAVHLLSPMTVWARSGSKARESGA